MGWIMIPADRETSMWVHTVSYHPVGSVFGWEDPDSPTGWWSGIVRQIAACSVKVDNILPGKLKG